MDEILNRFGPESSPSESRMWISRIVIAVVLGEAIWGFLVAIAINLALPGMARVMGGDAQSPLYLGKGDFNVPALFTSFLELCFAGILAILLNSWSQKPGHVRSKPVRPIPSEATAAPVVTPLAASPATPAADTTIQEAQNPVRSVLSTPQPPPPSPHLVKPAKPKPPRAVYYNSVGEPVDRDDE